MNLKENIQRIREMMGIKSPEQNIIVEASKKDILINKLGFSSDNAETLANAAGPFAVWLGNKLMDVYANKYLETHLKDYGQTPEQKEKIKIEFADPQKRKQRVLDFFNRVGGVRGYLSIITSIMDWIRVGLNGNVKPYMNMSFEELYDLSREWHDSLEAGQGDFNYNENNKVLRDYRDKDGIGFYWVDLKTNSSDEECDRMGHCGRTDSGNSLYSLRRAQRINKDFTLNKSYLTAAVGENNGLIYQLKGPKNSKPDEKYHPYIVDLILNNDHIKGFGSEYESNTDFQFSDLSKEDSLMIYSKKPQLFNSLKLKLYLKNELGLENIDIPNMKPQTKIPLDFIPEIIDGDWVIGERKNPRGIFDRVWFTEAFLSDNIRASSDIDYDWYYFLDDENINKIHEIFKSRNGDKYNPKWAGASSKNYEDNPEIKTAIDNAFRKSLSPEYFPNFYNDLMSAMNFYGNVLELNQEGAVIEIDLEHMIDYYDEDGFHDVYEMCNGDLICVLYDLFVDRDTPKPHIEGFGSWESSFNSILQDELNKIK
jgi:hypothetical protein